MSKKYNKAAALKVQYALDHHGKPLRPIFSALQSALDWSGIMHCIESSRGGNNSNYIRLEDGRQIILRGRMRSGPKPFIAVRLRGTLHDTKLFNERDAIRYVEALKP